MVWGTLFPFNPLPPTLLALMAKFKNAAEVRALVRNQLIVGAEVVFAFVLARYPTLNLELIANGLPLREDGEPVDLNQYYPLVRNPATIVVDKLDRDTEADLLARAEQRARGSD
jgi:hypothetical protein